MNFLAHDRPCPALTPMIVHFFLLLPLLLAPTTQAQTAADSTLSPDAKAALKQHAAKDTNHDGLVSIDEEIAFAAKIAPAKFKPSDLSLPVVGKPAPGTKAVAEPTLNSWLERNVQVRQTFFNAKDSNNPAKFAWTKKTDEGAYYTVDAAVVLTSLMAPREFTLGNQAVWAAAMPVFEAHFSNQNNTHTAHNSQNSLLYALPVTFTYGRKFSPDDIRALMKAPIVNEQGSQYQTSDWIDGGEFTIFPAYRTDRDADIRALEMGVFWRPGVWVKAGLNRRQFLFGDTFSFRWDPMFGLETGRYEDGSKLLAPNAPDDYCRAVGRLHLEVGITSRLAITLDYTRRYNFLDANRDYHFRELSLVYQLDPDRVALVADASGEPATDKDGKPKRILVPGHFRIGASWKKGKDAPAFEQADTYSGWLGVQF